MLHVAAITIGWWNMLRHCAFVLMIGAVPMVLGSGASATAGVGSGLIERGTREARVVVVRVRNERRHKSANEDDMALFEEGQYEFSARDYRSARRAFEELTTKFPDSEYALKAQKYLAMIYAREQGEGALDRASLNEAATGGVAGQSPILTPRREQGRLFSPQPSIRTDVREPVVDARLQQMFLLHAGDRVFFAEQSARLGRKAEVALARQAKWMRARRGLRFRVIGHADDGGSHNEDERLSRERALAVRERLVAAGIPDDLIDVVAAGRSQRLADCSDPGCAAQNRRVIIQMLRSDDPIRDATAVGRTKTKH